MGILSPALTKQILSRSAEAGHPMDAELLRRHQDTGQVRLLAATSKQMNDETLMWAVVAAEPGGVMVSLIAPVSRLLTPVDVEESVQNIVRTLLERWSKEVLPGLDPTAPPPASHSEGRPFDIAVFPDEASIRWYYDPAEPSRSPEAARRLFEELKELAEMWVAVVFEAIRISAASGGKIGVDCVISRMWEAWHALWN